MASVQLNPYLQFRDQARDAMAFYRAVFDGELTMQAYAEGGMSGHPSNDDRIMHAQLVTPHGLVLMASDVLDGVDHQPGSAISVSLSGDDESALRVLACADPPRAGVETHDVHGAALGLPRRAAARRASRDVDARAPRPRPGERT